MIVSGICIVAAAFFLLRGELNIAFVVATLGIVAWFLNYRIQMKAITTAADLEQRNKEEMTDGEDSDED
jgi:preprotein translocase subunit SecF